MAAADNPVDRCIGARVRQRRRQLGLSQALVAEQLGLTVQQVQDHEAGADRISASSLFRLSEILKTPVAWFFETTGMTEAANDAEGPSRSAPGVATPPDDEDILAVWRRIPLHSRRAVLDILRATYDSESSPGLG